MCYDAKLTATSSSEGEREAGSDFRGQQMKNRDSRRGEEKSKAEGVEGVMMK